jgi:hypothetical protein
MDQPEPLHPANAEAIAEFAEETGAEVLRGDLRYPSYSGGGQLGDIDFSEHLAKYRDHEVVKVVASTRGSSTCFSSAFFTSIAQ